MKYLAVFLMICLCSCTIHTKPTYQYFSSQEVIYLKPSKDKDYAYQCTPEINYGEKN